MAVPSTAELLQSILEELQAIREEVRGEEGYLPIVGTVAAGTPYFLDLTVELGRNAKRGFIRAVDGDIILKFNNLREFTLELGDTYDLSGHSISRIDVRTISTINVNFFGVVM